MEKLADMLLNHLDGGRGYRNLRCLLLKSATNGRHENRIRRLQESRVKGNIFQFLAQNPKMKGPHVEAECHVICKPFLQLCHDPERMYRIPIVSICVFQPEEPALKRE